MKKETTIYDIAKELKISASTVSRGLRNSEEVKKRTANLIAKKAKEMGYRPNNFAANLRTKHTDAIGVIVPKLSSHFIASALAGMECVAHENRYNLIIAQSLEKYEKEKETVSAMFANRVDGLLLSLASDTKDLRHLTPFLRAQTPVILFDRAADSENISSITIDNYQAAYETTQHLIAQGCQSIVHLAGNDRRDLYAGRIKGYKDALLGNNIAFREDRVWRCDLDEKAGVEAARKILLMPPSKRPDAVFAANDIAAIYCMLHLKEHGVNIPRDICIAGFNNDPVCSMVQPGLTSVNYSGFEMGKMAALSLIDLIRYPQAKHPVTAIVMHANLVIRESSLRKRNKH